MAWYATPLCLLLQTLPLTILAYSTGAPAEGCWSERPLHRDFLPQGGPSLPFEITTNASSYGPSQTILVTISSPVAMSHKGYLVRVVTSSGRRGGHWAVDRTLQRYNPECGVTHRDPRSRAVTTVLWRSPSALLGSLGNIQFKAIVVANMSLFWDNVLSHTLSPVYPDASIATTRRYQRMFDMLDVGKDKPKSDGNQGQQPLANEVPSPALSSDSGARIGGIGDKTSRASINSNSESPKLPV